MTVEEHSRLHSSVGKTMCELICPSCKKKFIKERRHTFLVQPSEITFCSRKCIGNFNYRKASKEKIKSAKQINLLQIIAE